MAPLKVLIAGGGLTGPALAYWLSKVDCDVTVVERSPNLRASGQQIDLRGQGVTTIKRMGIEPTVRTKLVDEQGVQFVDGRGNVKAWFASNKTGKGKQSFSAEYEIMRGDLCQIMYDITKDTAKYLFGTSIEAFDQVGEKVHVRFSDGKKDEFDLVVGADGQGSRTRRQLVGNPADVEDPFRFLKLWLCYFTIPHAPQDEMKGSIYHMTKYRVASTRVDNPKTTQVYLAVHGDSSDLEAVLKSGDQQKQKQAWADVYKDETGWEVPRIMDDMLHSEPAKDFYFQKIGQVKLDKWSKGRVALVGDAAYCPSPITGKGTTVGIVGAYVLAGEIAKQLEKGHVKSDDAVEKALEGYERILRPFVDECQSLPPGVPRIAYVETTWGIAILHFVVGLIATLRINKLAEWFGSDEIGKWKMPDYPELRYQKD